MYQDKTDTKDTTVYLNRQIKRYNERRIEEISDKCLLCGKCTAVCPVGIQGDMMRIAQRSVRKYKLAPSYANIDENALLERCNKFVNTSNNTVTSDRNQRVMYFAGCMTSLTPSISKSTAAILQKAGIRFEIMDKDGGICCGRPMLMAGRIAQAKEMIEKNTAIIKASGADTLLLSCPICYKIFKADGKASGETRRIELAVHTAAVPDLSGETPKSSAAGTDSRHNVRLRPSKRS